MRKADILKLAEKHNDVQFAIYTNSTLIDEPFCKEVVRLGNIAFMLSIEGTPETNDARRGEGHYAAVMRAMDLLKEHGILFGTSICYTRDNIEAVTSDEFMRFLCDKGAHFGFYFHYMPVGNEAAPELMPSPEQRKYMIQRIRYPVSYTHLDVYKRQAHSRIPARTVTVKNPRRKKALQPELPTGARMITRAQRVSTVRYSRKYPSSF